LQWQHEDDRLAQQGIENPYEKFHGWLTPFMCARYKLTESGDASFYRQNTSKVAQGVLRDSSEDLDGERKNDALTKAMQTKEQQDHVRGVFSKLT
jgi:hypothetical protein